MLDAIPVPLDRIPSVQTRIDDFTGQTQYDNLPPSGDPFPYETDDTILRIAFQNIHGATIRGGLRVPPEIDTMLEWNVDIMGMSETNRPWTPQNRSTYDYMMNTCFQSSRTLYTSAPAPDHTLSYLPGGNLLTINGRTTGRIITSGSDALGRFCWFTLRGRRDEGILIIVAYRVCHEASHNPGAFTAYQQQYSGLRTRGILAPNPRKQVLLDMTDLINTHRRQGFRPIVLMDANGDYITGKDNDLATFVTCAGLSDPFYDRFHITPATYVYGSRRIDYIFLDPELTSAVIRVGYLGTHEGVPSDHVMAVIDVDETKLFAGIINRPPSRHSREILIEQSDKVNAFLTLLASRFKEHSIQNRIFDLARLFVEHGPTPSNVKTYHTLYQQFLELTRGASREVGRKKFGYMRSPPLTTQGRILNAHVMLLDCKTRGAPASPASIRLCQSLDMDAIHILSSNTLLDLRRLVRSHRARLWEIQKSCEEHRYEWLTQIAQDRSRAEGDPDWEKKLAKMKRTARDCATNRKLGLIVKGRRGVLDRIQIPTGQWYYSDSKQELYHYNDGVFEAHPARDTNLFFKHHTIKVPPLDSCPAIVEPDPSGHFWVLITSDPNTRIEWTDITSQGEIERALLIRNERHLRQTEMEKGVSTRPPLTDIRGNYGFNSHTSAILDTGRLPGFNITPEMAALFTTLQRSAAEARLTPILGELTPSDVQLMFKKAKERTSSDSNTLNYTLWKCLAGDDTFAGIMSVLFSLPFMYGFVNEHWTLMTDFMLEKKPGVRQIHTLRIIGKVAAEFNTCLKFLIGKKAMENFEAAEPHDDQHGFRPHRSSIDAGFLKLLTFECARMQKCTVGTVQHDMSAHFDRMYPAMTSIFASKYGVDPNVMMCINRTIAQLGRRVETALGVSKGTYGHSSDPPLGGMVQGKADVPQWSTQQSDALLKAHQTLTTGLTIRSPTLSRSIRRNALAFADDTDSQESRPPGDPDPIPPIVASLQNNAQTWSNLVQICGGLIALHKCNWQLLAWEYEHGKWKLITSTTARVVMEDGHETYAVIDFLPPDQPNVGLGFRICPNGSHSHHYQATRDAVVRLCGASQNAYLTEIEVHQLLRQRLLPKLVYSLHVSSFPKAECYRLNADIRGSFLPRLRLNRHLPHPVLYGPKQYGGLEFPEIYALQEQVQVEYLLKQLRWNKTVANDLQVTLENIQLCSGLIHLILEYTHPPVDYLDTSYLLDVRRRLAEIDASMWIEGVWTPPLQRIGDVSLMERFLTLPGVTRAHLRQANAVRLYLRVITIADLCDPLGTYIPSGMLNGDWRAGSDLLWPFQPQPPKPYFATFRRLLRLGFCRNTPIHHHWSDSLTLDTPLGKWLPVARTTWFPVYRTPDELYWRQKDDETLFVLVKSQTSGFYHFSHTTTILPLHSHPITYQQIGQTLWTQRPYRIHVPRSGTPPPPGHLISNTLIDPATEVITIGCDGSVYLKHEVAACAWMIATSETNAVTACILLANISSISSYRSELEGIYRSLTHVRQLGLTPTEVQQWCDNEGAVDASNHPLYTPASMLQPDADILLAIHHLRTHMEASFPVTCRHIYGHQDTRQRGTPRSLTTPDLVVSHPIPMDDGEDSLRLHETLWEARSHSSNDTSRSLDEHDPPHTFSYSYSHSLSLSPSPSRTHPPDIPAPKPKPLSVIANIECDRIASETAKIAVDGDCETNLPPVLLPPYPGSRAMLRIGTTWITSKTKTHLSHARWTEPIITYCMNKYGWTRDTIDDISWRSIGSARNKCTATQLTQTTKLMHDWLPSMHMQAHMTGTTQCPSCPHPDETLDHIFHCPHPFLQCKRDLILAQLQKKGLKLRIPYPVVSIWCSLLEAYFDNTPLDLNIDPDLRRAIDAQLTIGTQYFPRGFLSKQWISVMEAYGCENPHRKLASMIYFLWIDVTDSLWRTRNELVHQSRNLNERAEEGLLDERLHWYSLHFRSHLSRHDYRLVRQLTSTDLTTMPLRTKRRWLQHLDTSRAAFEAEQKTLPPGQTLLTQYFPFRGSTSSNISL